MFIQIQKFTSAPLHDAFGLAGWSFEIVYKDLATGRVGRTKNYFPATPEGEVLLSELPKVMREMVEDIKAGIRVSG